MMLMMEIENTLKKGPVVDGLPAEVYQHAAYSIAPWLVQIFGSVRD